MTDDFKVSENRSAHIKVCSVPGFNHEKMLQILGLSFCHAQLHVNMSQAALR